MGTWRRWKVGFGQCCTRPNQVHLFLAVFVTDEVARATVTVYMSTLALLKQYSC